MDISQTTAPKSDQQNFDDYIGGPKTVTIEKVTPGSLEQPVDVHLVEFPGRPYRPSKSMRRVMIKAWGIESAAYTGRRMTLYGDPEVTFGRDKVGGIKISHLSHIEKRLTLALTVTRGRRAPFNVEPLANATPTLTTVPSYRELLAEIGALADKTPGGRKAVAADWAETHEGESLRDATDLGGLELLRDDLKVRLPQTDDAAGPVPAGESEAPPMPLLPAASSASAS